MTRRTRPSAPPSKIVPALLAAAIVATGFAILLVRLEVTQEGYRLSTLRLEIRNLETQNQRLKLETARLESHQRLRALAPKFGLAAPAPGHVVMVP
ncbi:MAG: Cell division protein FtsL [Candidatus Binataceae bacterium]|jgi:cell division protein FtsL|nr:Cell division protein FtsL [Candidatus Binataceae bacterium]MEA2680568.1 Cell division protein FtsL [Candidatus Binataceae bacterium]